jgi:hypothetical protein
LISLFVSQKYCNYLSRFPIIEGTFPIIEGKSPIIEGFLLIIEAFSRYYAITYKNIPENFPLYHKK